jgi:type 1 fimbriae regulatory protein FimB/type 1 fimbriae regulatory protein FimE
MAKSNLALAAPSTVNSTVARKSPPRRRPNIESRAREYLTAAAEVERLIKAAGDNRHCHRNATMVLIAFRHGLRPAEALALRWDAVEFAHGRLHVSRIKGSADSVHPLSGRELRMLRRLKREQDPPSPFVFTSEWGAPFAIRGFRAMVARLGEAAGFEHRVHPHQLRHACGYVLANHGTDTGTLQDYLGHRNIQHTVRYTRLWESKFKKFWPD